jgi:transposase
MMMSSLFEAALAIKAPWYIRDLQFDEPKKTLTIQIDFYRGSQFPHPSIDGGLFSAYDTQTKRYRHLNFFQHECILEVRVPRVQLPDGSVRLIEPEWSGKLNGFTLLFEAMVVFLAQHSTFQFVADLMNISWYRVHAICTKYVELALERENFSAVTAVAIDETSCRRGHDYLTIVADMTKRRVVHVTPGKDAETVESFAMCLETHQGNREQISSVSIDMSAAFIKGVNKSLPQAQITFDKFHVVAHASTAVDETRRAEQKSEEVLKKKRWLFLKDTSKLTSEQREQRNNVINRHANLRTVRAWLYREELREILDGKQINVMERKLKQWCTNVMRSKIDQMKRVAKMIREHMDGIVAWARSRQTNGFIEAINGLFQAAKRKARGYGRFDTMRTVIFLIAGKLNFLPVNPHVADYAR